MRQPTRPGGPKAGEPPRRQPAASRARIATEQRKQPAQARSRALVDALVEAMARLIAAEGQGAVTTTRVAELAGVSVGSLYQYFPTRESLIAAVIQARARRDEERLEALLATLDGATLDGALRALAAFSVETFRESPRLYKEMVEAMSAVERERAVEATLERCTALTRRVLEPHRARVKRDLELSCYLLATALVAILRDVARRRPELLAGDTLVDELHALMVRYLVD